MSFLSHVFLSTAVKIMSDMKSETKVNNDYKENELKTEYFVIIRR